MSNSNKTLVTQSIIRQRLQEAKEMKALNERVLALGSRDDGQTPVLDKICLGLQDQAQALEEKEGLTPTLPRLGVKVGDTKAVDARAEQAGQILEERKLRIKQEKEQTRKEREERGHVTLTHEDCKKLAEEDKIKQEALKKASGKVTVSLGDKLKAALGQ